MERRLYRIREFAEATGTSLAGAYKHAANGALKTVRIGRTVLIPAEELERVLREGIQPQRTAVNG